MKKYSVRDICDSAKAAYLVNKYETPLYVYSQQILRDKIKRLLQAAHGFDIRYALKANTNSTIVKLIRELGVKSVDVVSPGQIYKALSCGYKPNEIMYTQNFISGKELDYALKAGVTLNIGALQTLQIHKDKLRGKNIFVRINPKVGAGTSYHVITGGPKSKFGVYEDNIDEFIKVAKENNIHIKGVHQHIGSNLKKKDEEVFLDTLKYVASLLPKFEEIEVFNLGGGLGVAYQEQEEISDPNYLYQKARQIINKWEVALGKSIKIAIEPGRFIIADCSTLLCSITACKSTPQKNFLGTDTGMNHLIRPALYGSHHEIVNLTNSEPGTQKVTICGNICECSDILGSDIQISGKVGDILGIENTGAYGFSMSSNYNQRPKPAEVMLTVQGEDILIRRRETFEDLIEKM